MIHKKEPIEYRTVQSHVLRTQCRYYGEEVKMLGNCAEPGYSTPWRQRHCNDAFKGHQVTVSRIVPSVCLHSHEAVGQDEAIKQPLFVDEDEISVSRLVGGALPFFGPARSRLLAAITSEVTDNDY